MLTQKNLLSNWDLEFKVQVKSITLFDKKKNKN